MILLLLPFLLPTSIANAHTGLVSSVPSAEQELDSLPSHVILEFEEDLLSIGGEKTNVITVTDSQGDQVDTGKAELSGRKLSVGISSSESRGDFTVTWRVVSGDGHPIQGSFKFSVKATASTSASSPSVIESPSGAGAAKESQSSTWDRYGSRIFVLTATLIAYLFWVRIKRREIRSSKEKGNKKE